MAMQKFYLQGSGEQRFAVPKQCSYILDKFQQAGFSAYLVGGCVRDSLLGKTPKDWDICTAALPEQTREIFAGEKIILTGLQHGTVTLLRQGMAVEITTYRIDGVYEDNRRPKEVFFSADLREDLSRRDFTINALAYHPEEGVVDCFSGQQDLAAGILRCVGDASARYQEDGLRIMRAIRFACILDFQYEAETQAAIISCSALLNNIARERIQAEFNQIMVSPHVARGVRDLVQFNCFPCFFPQLELLKGDKERNLAENPVGQQLLTALTAVEPELVLRLAVLLYHGGRFQDKDAQGMAALAQEALGALRYDRCTIQEVARLLEHYDLELGEDGYTVRKGLSLLGVDSLRRLVCLRRANQLALSRGDSQFNPAVILAEIDGVIAQQQCYSLKQLAVNGRDVMASGYCGAAVGEKLQELLDMVLREPGRNQRDDLLRQIALGERGTGDSDDKS